MTIVEFIKRLQDLTITYVNKYKHVAISAWEDFTAKKVIASASQLTYSTLLATVPILAVVFAIARGFGYSIFIEEWFRSMLEAQPDVCETVIGFVNSYLLNTKKGMFLGIGLVFMLWTVLMLISNIENTFNDIWQVHKKRSLFRKFTDYIAMLFLFPIFLVLMSGVSIWVTAINRHIVEYAILGSMMKILIEVFPYILTILLMTALYVFMPNAKVKLRSALVPGILSGLCFHLFQVIYINSQIWISNYNAIYGSFAILPFFMLWMQTSWSIVLVGAELSYMNQNREMFTKSHLNEPLCHDARIRLSAGILHLICERFNNGEPALTAMELKERTGISMRLLNNLIFDLQKINFIREIAIDDKGEETAYMPAVSPALLTKEEMTQRINLIGYTPNSNIYEEN